MSLSHPRQKALRAGMLAAGVFSNVLLSGTAYGQETPPPSTRTLRSMRATVAPGGETTVVMAFDRPIVRPRSAALTESPARLRRSRRSGRLGRGIARRSKQRHAGTWHAARGAKLGSAGYARGVRPDDAVRLPARYHGAVGRQAGRGACRCGTASTVAARESGSRAGASVRQCARRSGTRTAGAR